MGRDITIAQSSHAREEVMQNSSLIRRFWLNAGLSLSVASMPWTATIGLLGNTTIAILTSPASAQAAMLSRWEFDPSTQALSVTVPGGTTPRYFLAAEPARIVLDLPNTDLGTVPLEQTYGGPVRTIRVAQFAPGVTRIVLELAPGTVLAPGHVDLQQVDTGTGQGDRWVLRPLLAGEMPVAQSTSTAPASQPIAPEIATAPTPDEVETNVDPSIATPDPDSISHNLPPLEPGALEIPIDPPAVVTVPAPDASAQPESNEPETEAAVTPIDPPINSQINSQSVEPAAIADAPIPSPEVPVFPDTDEDSDTDDFETNDHSEANHEIDGQVTEPNGSSNRSDGDRSNLVRLPGPDPAAVSATNAPTADFPYPAAPATEVSTPASPNLAALPDAVPTNQQPATTPTVSVPPLDASPVTESDSTESPNTESPNTESPSDDVPNEPAPSQAIDAAPATADIPETQPTLATPSTFPSPATVNSAVPPIAPSAGSTIDFGQPLPKSAYPSPDNTVPQITQPPTPHSIGYASSNSVLLPSGTVLTVRYPGAEPLDLADGTVRQEVLVLTEAVHDQNGNVVFPEGSYVIGRFERIENQSQFIAQAISLQGHPVLVNAESDGLSSGDAATNHLLRNSAIGIATGVVLGITGVGLIPAIAAGAATTAGITFLPGSQPSSGIQPDQVLEIRLTQDLISSN